MAASHRAKLLNPSRERKEAPQFVLGAGGWPSGSFTVWGFPLGVISSCLFWKGELSRPTRDLDLLRYVAQDIPSLVDEIREFCSLPVDDGNEFNLGSIRGSIIRRTLSIDGIRVFL